MRIEDIKRISFALLAAFLFVNIIPQVYALSIGISPSKKTVELKEGEQGIVYFAVSQGSTETETVTISTDVNWLKTETESFDLAPMEQIYVKFNITPLSAGTYTAKIKASTSLSGVVGMKFSASAKLEVSVVSSASSIGNASTAIFNAQTMIQNAKVVGADTTDAESMVTVALEEFDRGNYDNAKRFADMAYSLALAEFQNASKSKTVLEPIKIALIVISVGASVVVFMLVYEVLKLKGSKEKTPKAPSIKCPQCGGEMLLTYDGTFVSNYVCAKCKHTEIKEKAGFK